MEFPLFLCTQSCRSKISSLSRLLTGSGLPLTSKISGFGKSSSNLLGEVGLDVSALLCRCWFHSSSCMVLILHIFLHLCTCTLPQLNISSGLRPRSIDNCHSLSRPSTLVKISTTCTLVPTYWRSISSANMQSQM